MRREYRDGVCVRKKKKTGSNSSINLYNSQRKRAASKERIKQQEK